MQITDSIVESVALRLAPMEGVTEWPLRTTLQIIGGVVETCTPFLRVTETFPSKAIPRDFIPEALYADGRVPLPQLMASSADDFCRVADKMLTTLPVVNLNCGCPSPKVVGNAAGSGLLRDPDMFRKFLTTIAARFDHGQIGIKMRTGFGEHQEFSSLLNCFDGLKFHHLTVHGRTRSQRYTGTSQVDLIHRASCLLDVPVWGSGDIVDHASFSMIRHRAPNVRTWLVGRGALRHPWLIAELLGAERLTRSVQDVLAYLAIFALLDAGMRQWIDDESDVDVLTDLVLRANTIWSEHLNYTLHDWQNVVVPPRSLARIKMLWNYLRSSLPEGFMQPTLLRVNSFDLFAEALHRIRGQDSWLPTYRPECDWIYSGESNPAKECSN